MKTKRLAILFRTMSSLPRRAVRADKTSLSRQSQHLASEVDSLITSAIRNKAVLEFTYNGKQRVVEPQTYGLSTAGRKVLRAFERNDRRPGMAKLFEVSKILDLKKTGAKFQHALPSHNPQDSAMIEIFATLQRP